MSIVQKQQSGTSKLTKFIRRGRRIFDFGNESWSTFSTLTWPSLLHQTVIFLLQTFQLDLFCHNLSLVVDQITMNALTIFERAYFLVAFEQRNLAVSRALSTVLRCSCWDFDRSYSFFFSHSSREANTAQKPLNFYQINHRAIVFTDCGKLDVSCLSDCRNGFRCKPSDLDLRTTKYE